ncbi:hypothetical protein HDU83_000787 [Entophlyctis luteolus]|nr:hypothetical protein HDU83_000787 [Entophlyctis luteolus]
MRARKIDPLPQTFTIMISVYESQMQRGTAPEPVVRELLDRVVELKDELIAKNMFSTAHANAILNACISSSSVGGFEIGMGIYSILQLNFWEALKKATEISATTSALYNAPHVASIIKIVRSSENSLPIPDLVTYILMMRLLTKCKRNDMFKILTETDFVNSYFIPDDAFVTSLLRHYLTASEKDFKTQLFGFSAAALDMPVLMEYVPLAHRKMVYENRLRECLHKNGNLLVLSPKLLDVFLRAVTKVPVQSVRVDVISELRERGVLNEQNIDDAVARLILAILLNCNDYNGAKSFAEFVHSFAKHKVEESVGIYEDLVSTIAVLAAQEFKIHSTHVRECRRMCNKLTSICEEKRLLAADGSSAVDLTDISGMKQRQRLCFIRFLSNLQTFIVDTGALIKIETDSLDGFGKILIVGLCIAERYVPICLKVVAKQKQGIDNSSFIKFLESSKAVLNEAQKYTAAMTKICDEFEFVKAGGPMEKRIVQWPRMVSDIDWVLKNLS